MRADTLVVIGGLTLIVLILGAKHFPELWRGVVKGWNDLWDALGGGGRFRH
ncbi:MAG: hypothetical protein H7Y17_14825 [Chlorobia bacterium]|nr:hypothetical protein [Fimbriimonadaceae bacterium]